MIPITFIEYILYVRNNAITEIKKMVLFPGTHWLVKQDTTEQMITSQYDKCFAWWRWHKVQYM